MHLMYIESRKKQDHMSKLGVWRPWEIVEGGENKGGKWTKIYSSENNNKRNMG